MKINNRELVHLDKKVANCDERLGSLRASLMIALAKRERGEVSRLSREVRRISEVRERWIAEQMETRFPSLRSVGC